MGVKVKLNSVEYFTYGERYRLVLEEGVEAGEVVRHGRKFDDWGNTSFGPTNERGEWGEVFSVVRHI